jgi:hypothetical protein
MAAFVSLDGLHACSEPTHQPHVREKFVTEHLVLARGVFHRKLMLSVTRAFANSHRSLIREHHQEGTKFLTPGRQPSYPVGLPPSG